MRTVKETRAWFWETAGPYCRKCGYGKSTRALHCHHLNKAQKQASNDTVARALCRGFNATVEWVKRSDFTILCANCHAELHDKLWSADEMQPINDRFGTMRFLDGRDWPLGVLLGIAGKTLEEFDREEEKQAVEAGTGR